MAADNPYLGCRRAWQRSCAGAGGDGQPGEPPVGEPSLQWPGRKAACPQQPYRVGGKNAVAAAAVGNDVGAFGESGEPGSELVVRHVDRAGDVPGRVFGLGPHVQHQDPPVVQPPEQLVVRDWFERSHISQIRAGGLLCFREPGRGVAMTLKHAVMP
jgi:hypothetical protein